MANKIAGLDSSKCRLELFINIVAYFAESALWYQSVFESRVDGVNMVSFKLSRDHREQLRQRGKWFGIHNMSVQTKTLGGDPSESSRALWPGTMAS